MANAITNAFFDEFVHFTNDLDSPVAGGRHLKGLKPLADLAFAGHGSNEKVASNSADKPGSGVSPDSGGSRRLSAGGPVGPQGVGGAAAGRPGGRQPPRLGYGGTTWPPQGASIEGCAGRRARSVASIQREGSRVFLTYSLYLLYINPNTYCGPFLGQMTGPFLGYMAQTLAVVRAGYPQAANPLPSVLDARSIAGCGPDNGPVVRQGVLD